MSAVKDSVYSFGRSIELPLDKKLKSAKETGLKYFKQKAKGSANLRQEYELLLIQKMEQKATKLQSDFNCFYRSWTAAWRVEELVMDDR